jgi:ABC-type multidrug transport system ATPase subunit
MLSIKNLNKVYSNGINALRDISLEMPTGLFGLLGPNGAGKSTLMRTIATLQKPDSGSIHFDGIDVVQNPELLRQQLGYLPQDFGVYPKVSAERMLNHFAVLKGLDQKSDRKEVVEHLLQQTNLWEVRKQYVDTFSGGMRQRFGIAQALLGSPSLVIVDEPTAGLDPRERHRLQDLLAEIAEKAVLILSTHIIEDIMDLCPRMAVIQGGRVLFQGDPSHATEAMNGKVWFKAVSKDELADYTTNLKILSSRRVRGKLQIHVLSTHQPDSGFQPIAANLEDVYFSLLASSETDGNASQEA